MKKKTINIFGLLTVATLLLGGVAHAQTAETVTVNHGQLYIQPNTVVSTHFDFENTVSGVVFNDGEFEFYKNYENNGLFTHTNARTTGFTIFQGSEPQFIAGSQPSKHYNVLFNNASSQYPFDLNSDMIINGTGDFSRGIVRINRTEGGQMLFGNGASSANASDASYAEGLVEKEGNNAFVFPIGKSGHYRLAGISAPANVAHLYTGEYFQENTNSSYPHKDRTGIIEVVDDREYWTIQQTEGTNGSVVVTLSWHEETTPAHLTANGASGLHVVRWDEIQQLWVDEGGIVDYAARTVTTPVDVEGFGVFTLGKVKEKFLNPGDVVIYNGVTPDNDGINDYLIIDNIEQFPNNNVSIFNRWGRKVFETQSYNSNGNVFKGIAEGSGVSGKGEKLPTGTYYYVVEYLYDRNGENQWVKKVGYLHLENNN